MRMLSRFPAGALVLLVGLVPADAAPQSASVPPTLTAGPGVAVPGKSLILTGPIRCATPAICDVSGTSVPAPSTIAPAGTLSNLFANRLLLLGNDLTANPDNSIADKAPLGNTAAKHFLLSHRKAAANALLGTTAILRNTVGSGTFGPAAADYALVLSTVKDNWNTATGATATEGELDTLIITARQGKKGDVGAYIADVLKRRDNLTSMAFDESGGGGIFEGNLGLVDASGSTYQRMHALIGMAEAPGAVSGGLGYGGYMETRAGTWFSAYHASSLVGQADETGQIVSNSWKYYFTGAQSRDSSTLNYMVDNTGRTFSGFPSAQMSVGFDAIDNAWTFRDATNNAERVRIARDSGGLTLTGQYGSITMVDPVTGAAAGGSHRLTSGGNGNVYYQVSSSTNFRSAAIAYHVAPDGSFNLDNLLKLKSYTVASLPACVAASRDSLLVVTDATSPTYRGALTGGGTVRTPVYCDGTSWTAH